MNVSENIILGIISGLLTSIFAYSALQAFKKIILPWYQKVTYKGLDISGEWFERQLIGGLLNQESTIFLKQVAHRVSGDFTIVKRGKANDIFLTKSFAFEGSFYDNFLNISCWTKDRKQLGTANYLLSVTGNGGQLSGQKCWYDVGSKRLISEEINWSRLGENKVIL